MQEEKWKKQHNEKKKKQCIEIEKERYKNKFRAMIKTMLCKCQNNNNVLQEETILINLGSVKDNNRVKGNLSNKKIYNEIWNNDNTDIKKKHI